ncbi:MAG: hypothetical protein H0V86_05300 [Chloroflexia bacterium]|nr:hypothetical protein [Chloroflexia bacterium]
MSKVVGLRKVARVSVVCLAVSLLSLVGVVLFGLVVPAADRGVTAVRIAAGLLIVGLFAAAVLGHVLGLVAFFRLGTEAPQEPARVLALVSVVLGILMLLSCPLLGVLSAPAFDSVTGTG